MHSFLSKVFGRKKDDKETSPTTLAPGELLEGRFEAVSPNVSPNATHFLELDPKTNGHNKDPFTFFKAKSRPASPELAKKLLDTLPHLSLNFSEFKERPLDPDLDVEGLLTDAVIGQRRLNPLEALVLIRACSQAIIARGVYLIALLSYISNIYYYSIRSRNPRAHAPALVFIFTRNSAQTHFTLPQLISSSERIITPLSNFIFSHFRFRV